MRIYFPFEAVLARVVRKLPVEVIRADASKWIKNVGRRSGEGVDCESPELTALM